MRTAKEWEDMLATLSSDLVRQYDGGVPESIHQTHMVGFLRRVQADALEAAALALHARLPSLSDDTPETWQCIHAIRKLKETA